MLEPRRLLTFREVARRASFSRAAEALSLTQPAVSQQVAALEREIGLELIDRRPGGLALTEAGELLLGHADALSERLRVADAQLEELAGRREAKLAVGAFASAMGTVVPDAVARWRQDASGVAVEAIEVSSADAAEGVREGRLHVGACFEDASAPPREHPGARRHDLGLEPMDAAVGPQHRLARRRRLEPRYLPLFWRIFSANAVVLAAAFLVAVLILSPGAFTSPVAIRELAIFGGALIVMVAVDLVVTRALVAPLDELVAVMRGVDPMRPGDRVTVGGKPSEATELAEAFNEMLERLEVEREESIRRVIGAQEAERLRVAQELHDEIGQNLTAALLQLARVRRRAGPEFEAEVAEATETVRANLDDLRRIAQRLRPQALDELGLTSALSQFTARLSAQAGLPIEARLESGLPALTREEELVIYRVAQEALTNVVRHADATHSELVLERSPDRLTLRVTDDGRGIDGIPDASGGIRGMHERATLIHADLTVAPRPEGGTEVTLHVPLSPDGLWYR
jgi:two-component system, NarL family, sensor histidine kinase UhpB